MLGQKNISHVIVGKDLAPLTETQTRDDLVAGKIGVFKNGSATAIDGTTDLVAGDRFKIVFMNVEGNIIESPFFDYDNIVAKNAVNYVADTEQLTYVGYNGTTGSIAVNNSDEYYIHLDRRSTTKQWVEHNLYKLVGGYTSDATATQTEIADALAVNIDKNLQIEKTRSGQLVTKGGRINSATVTAANAFDNNAAVVNGVNAFTVTTNLEYNGGVGTLAVGDYVRLGSVGGGTALTSQVYKVTAINSLVVTVDRKILEASGTYAAATADFEVIPAATAIAANWGLSFQSVAGKFVPGLFKFDKTLFSLGLSEAFGNTLVTTSTAATKGSGTYKEVAEIEWELKNNRGETYRVADYPVNETLNAVSGKTYDTINLQVVNDNSTSIDSDVKSWIGLTIFTENESASTIHTDLKDILNIS